MKITKSQLKTTNAMLKPLEGKDQIISLQIVDGTVNILAKKDGAVLNLKMIKTDEPDGEKISIKKDLLLKLEKQSVEEIELKINKKKMRSNINGVNFETNILTDEVAVNFLQDEKVKGIKIGITPEIMKTINTAANYVSKDAKRATLLGVNLKLEKGSLSINASDSIVLYTNSINVDTEGEFDIILNPDTLSLLNAIHDLNTNRTFPVLISENNIYIISKGMYYKSVLISGQFPNLVRVLDKVEESETLEELEITEEMIKKIKSINNKSHTLDIEKTKGKVKFTTKTEIDENYFETKVESESENWIKRVNYNSLLTILNSIQSVKIKGDYLSFEKDKNRVILLSMKN